MQLTIKDAFPWSRVLGAEKTKRMVEIVTWKVEFQMIPLRAGETAFCDQNRNFFDAHPAWRFSRKQVLGDGGAFK